MKKRAGVLIISVMALALAAGCGIMQTGKEKPQNAHAGLTDQQKLIACYDCHKQTTPEISNQWYDSTHGIGNVKCYQCHNSFNNIVKTPDVHQSCNACHTDKVGNEDHTGGIGECWECHGVHSFVAE